MNTILFTIDDVYDLTQIGLIERAGKVIREGGLVAFPTETVYGLGANALDEEASAKIYTAKGRPSDNPLIVHICDIAQVDEIAYDISEEARAMMEKFWPGPLTVIFKKKACVPDGTTGGLSTVAIRMPSHPIARKLIELSGCMIAAPSANVSGRPSPTLAEHVYEDLYGRIPLILDGGPVEIGIESTIIDLSGEVPTILRPGYISKQMLEEIFERVEIDPAVSSKTMRTDIVAKAPGMKYRHYAPDAPMTLVEGSPEQVFEKIVALTREKLEEGAHVAIITTDELLECYEEELYAMDAGKLTCLSIGRRRDTESVSANLYRLLRDMNERKVDYIFSESFFEEGLGDAIMNRMLKASGYQLIEA